MSARRRPARPETVGGVSATIICVDCGGTCFVLSHVPEDGFEPGDVVAYRCAECQDRWDVVVAADDDDVSGPDSA